jgi:hypothetical protein
MGARSSSPSSPAQFTSVVQLLFICPYSISSTPRITCSTPPPPSYLPPPRVSGEATSRYAADFACIAAANSLFSKSKGVLVLKGIAARLSGDWGAATHAFAAAAASDSSSHSLPSLLKSWVNVQLEELHQLLQQQQQQQQQWSWMRSRSTSRVTSAGGDGR